MNAAAYDVHVEGTTKVLEDRHQRWKFKDGVYDTKRKGDCKGIHTHAPLSNTQKDE